MYSLFEFGEMIADRVRTDRYSEALRLNADNPEAQFNLGMAFRRQGKREEAAAHYRAALRLKPDYSAAQQQLEALRR